MATITWTDAVDAPDFIVFFDTPQPRLQASVGTNGEKVSMYQGEYPLRYVMHKPHTLEVRTLLDARHAYLAIKEFLARQELADGRVLVQKLVGAGSIGGPVH